jgi:SAM-dependent methyltransferase
VDQYQQANLALWNEWAEINAKSKSYDLEGFKAGKNRLKSIELEEVGDVRGKTLLHLQCHFGLDTLSWARRGASVTGVDFSDKAIALAQAIGQEVGLDARFIRSDLYELPNILSGQFDVVFTSYGVLCWLRDLKRWAEIIAHFLKPGGVFYIAEIHPFLYVFDDEDPAELRVKYSYFHQPEPTEWQVSGSYADREAKVNQPVDYEWTHSLGEIVSALAAAGLKIEFLHEFDRTVDRTLMCMEQDAEGWWRLKGQPGLPLVFSIRAVK